MLIEIHLLQNHAPSNLNRDDTGSPKECIFGGVKRARISSQCLKRSIRRSEMFQTALSGNLATRTRRLPELVKERLLAEGMASDLAEVAAKKATGFGTGEGKENTEGKLETAQTMFLTEADITAVTDVLKTAATSAGTAAKFEKVAAKDLQAQAIQKGFRPLGVDVALFGRMTTSEAFRDVEAAVQVAHALSTHKVEAEYDYFTAVDDLQGRGEEEEDAGADMIGDVEFNSACYYKYFSLDVAGIVDNLTGAGKFRREISAEEKQQANELMQAAVEALLRAAVMTTPTGKQNSFAAHQLPSAVLVEVRPQRTPVSYANAFVEPARAGKGDDLVRDSLTKLARHAEALTNGFNLATTARLLLAPAHSETEFTVQGVERVPDLNTLCARLREVIANG